MIQYFILCGGKQKHKKAQTQNTETNDAKLDLTNEKTDTAAKKKDLATFKFDFSNLDQPPKQEPMEEADLNLEVDTQIKPAVEIKAEHEISDNEKKQQDLQNNVEIIIFSNTMLTS